MVIIHIHKTQLNQMEYYQNQNPTVCIPHDQNGIIQTKTHMQVFINKLPSSVKVMAVGPTLASLSMILLTRRLKQNQSTIQQR